MKEFHQMRGEFHPHETHMAWLPSGNCTMKLCIETDLNLHKIYGFTLKADPRVRISHLHYKILTKIYCRWFNATRNYFLPINMGVPYLSRTIEIKAPVRAIKFNWIDCNFLNRTQSVMKINLCKLAQQAYGKLDLRNKSACSCLKILSKLIEIY